MTHDTCFGIFLNCSKNHIYGLLSCLLLNVQFSGCHFHSLGWETGVELYPAQVECHTSYTPFLLSFVQ